MYTLSQSSSNKCHKRHVSHVINDVTSFKCNRVVWITSCHVSQGLRSCHTRSMLLGSSCHVTLIVIESHVTCVIMQYCVTGAIVSHTLVYTCIISIEGFTNFKGCLNSVQSLEMWSCMTSWIMLEFEWTLLVCEDQIEGEEITSSWFQGARSCKLLTDYVEPFVTRLNWNAKQLDLLFPHGFINICHQLHYNCEIRSTLKTPLCARKWRGFN